MSERSKARRRELRREYREAGVSWSERSAAAESWGDGGCGYTQADYEQMVREDQDAAREYDLMIARERMETHS